MERRRLPAGAGFVGKVWLRDLDQPAGPTRRRRVSGRARVEHSSQMGQGPAGDAYDQHCRRSDCRRLLGQAVEVVLKTRILRIGLFVIVAWVIVAWMAPRVLEVNAPLASADAIVVLSGSSAYRERTDKAAQLYRE